MAAELVKAGIPVSLTLDAAVGTVLEGVDLVLVGAEGVVENGGIINQVGGRLSLAHPRCAPRGPGGVRASGRHADSGHVRQSAEHARVRGRGELQVCKNIPAHSTRSACARWRRRERRDVTRTIGN